MLATLLSNWKERGTVEAVELDTASDRYPDLARVRAYWEAKRGGRFAPRRADIDPVDLRSVLPRVMLADVIGGAGRALDFRYRLAGTGIYSVHGEDATGKSPRAFMPRAYGALIHAHYCEAVRRRVPLLHLIVLDTLERARSYARLLLPLSEDGAAVTMLLAVDSKEQNSAALRGFFAEVMGEP
jgi:hypothetical protein